MATTAHLPTRLHHTAYVTRDLEATLQFYEGVIGLPLIATWCEVDELFGSERVYCHLFFGLADGSALAFFKFAKPEDEELFAPPLASSPFRHIALSVDEETQQRIESRLVAAGYKEPDMYVLDHGYCRSVYVTDPNGMILEFTRDELAAELAAPERQARAKADLARWMSGDHRSNNTYRG